MPIIPRIFSLATAWVVVVVAGVGASSATSQQQQQQESVQDELQSEHRHLRARIVGGSPAEEGRHPYFAQWQGALCGATVIHDDILISAAHCYDEFNPPPSRNVLLGSTTRDTGIPRRYVEVVPHPQYGNALNENVKDFDLVLIKTAVSMLTTTEGTPSGVEVLPLNRNPAVPAVDDALMAVGFGQTAENNPTLSNELRDVLLYSIENDFCAEQYPLGGFNENLMFCSGVPGGGKDTCQGDSGGPIITYSAQEPPVLAGVISWGTGCGRGDYSGVNARISAMSTWIDAEICRLSSFPPANCPTVNPAQGGNQPSSVVSSANEPAGSPANNPNSNPSRPFGTPSNGGVAPLYNPRNTDLNSYPGESPRVPTHGVTINMYYAYRPLYVTWNLAMQQSGQGQEGADLSWRVLYRSIRGEAHSLQSQTFTNMQSGWYRLHIQDPEAERQLGPYDVSIGWMSVMGPRGDLIWGKPEGSENASRTSYDIYFQVTDRGLIDHVDGTPPVRQ